VSAGNAYSVAIRTGGALMAWGYNYWGTLGDGTWTYRYSPVQIGTSTDWRAARASYSHTMAVRADGSLWAWGDNSRGQLGDGAGGPFVLRSSPYRVGTGFRVE
jgi:alpha-tubulin suppressor-like RCC1 family protein